MDGFVHISHPDPVWRPEPAFLVVVEPASCDINGWHEHAGSMVSRVAEAGHLMDSTAGRQMALTRIGEESDGCPVMIRRELPDDVEVIRAVTAAAFRGVAHSAPPVEPGGDPGEATLVSRLREDAGWVARLSLVAVEDDVVVGHVVATRAHVDARPALGLGPLSVLPHRQRAGVGTALMHAVLGAADALGEPLVGLVGDPGFYHRFGFVPSRSMEIVAPDPSWGDYFQVRPLTQYDGVTGCFSYASPFDLL